MALSSYIDYDVLDYFSWGYYLEKSDLINICNLILVTPEANREALADKLYKTILDIIDNNIDASERKKLSQEITAVTAALGSVPPHKKLVSRQSGTVISVGPKPTSKLVMDIIEGISKKNVTNSQYTRQPMDAELLNKRIELLMCLCYDQNLSRWPLHEVSWYERQKDKFKKWALSPDNLKKGVTIQKLMNDLYVKDWAYHYHQYELMFNKKYGIDQKRFTLGPDYWDAHDWFVFADRHGDDPDIKGIPFCRDFYPYDPCHRYTVQMVGGEKWTFNYLADIYRYLGVSNGTMKEISASRYAITQAIDRGTLYNDGEGDFKISG